MSGTLRFGKVDVTEAQVTIMIIQLISAIFGSNIWTTKVTFQGPVKRKGREKIIETEALEEAKEELENGEIFSRATRIV